MIFPPSWLKWAFNRLLIPLALLCGFGMAIMYLTGTGVL